jgi:chemotaxis protein methyltransferase CheR
MPDLALTPPLFAILSSLVEERVGLSYTLQDQELFASKLWLRAGELGFESLLDYYYFLRYDANAEQEFELLVNSLVVNETFFFRELAPLQVLVDQFLAPLVERGQSPRIWCAACSTGEEPLSLAMLLEQRGLLDACELVATDISSKVLTRAQSGEHSRRSVRHVPVPELCEKWLTVQERGVTVHPRLQRAVSFRQLNLLDQPAIQELGTFDAILCRNVLIYFKDGVAARVVDTLTSQLRPRGLLLIGISESLLRFGTRLDCEEHGGVFVYRKAAP